jgi:crotonobetainyl-CoA:carnitine CoA-transferase CaiB-like acyl-CoA transferase
MDGAPLTGIVVISLEQAVSAPFATRQLADLGATVVKIERPGGDFARGYDRDVAGLSTHFVWTNRGKQSVVLDLTDDAGRATLQRLIAGADVFVHNVAPGAARRLGVDAETLRLAQPRLIACQISGYGSGGPRSDDKAYDLAIQAEAGVFSVTGGDEPSRVGFAAADISAGMYALTSILAALVRRDRTGEGASIEVSMLDSVAEWLSAQLYSTHYSGVQPPRTARRHPGIAPYGTFELSSGRSVLIAVQNDREWSALCETVLDHPELADDPRFRTNPDRIVHVDEVESIVRDRLAELGDVDALDLLRQAGIAIADVNDLSDLWQHPQLRERGRFTQVQTSGGSLEMLASPFGFPTPSDRPGVPEIGEHDPAVIESIIARGIAASESARPGTRQ